MAAVDDLSRRASNLPAKSRSTTLRVLALGIVLGVAALFPACSKDSLSCPVDDGDPCTLDQCQAGVAVNDYLGDGHPCFVGQLQGACKAGSCAIPCASASQCNDGLPCTRADCVQGACVIEADDHQTAPEDGNPCTEEHCLDGKVVSWQRPNGSACPGGECATGICGHCTTPTDCGSPSPCRTWNCENTACVPVDKPAGAPIVLGDFSGNCTRLLCDGTGNAVQDADPNDPPTSFDQCFEWICIGKTPFRQPKLADKCLMETGLIGLCAADGTCLQCLQDLDCGLGYRCDAGACAKCGDASPNGDETCGGSCGSCKGTSCLGDEDCASGHCVFTNASPPKVCCAGPCDGVCQQCSAVNGQCIQVPVGLQDDTCNDPGRACAGAFCKWKKGYPCQYGLDCVSGACVNGVCA